MKYFNTIFLDEADNFIAELDSRSARKAIYNIVLAEQTNDSNLFKKLQNDIWEFRTNILGSQIRLLAFWDKEHDMNTLVVVAHGFIKKVHKVPPREIKKAMSIRKKYFELKTKK